MQYLAELPSTVADAEEADEKRWRIPLTPSRPVGWALTLVALAVAGFSAVATSASIERWYAVRQIYRGNLGPAEVDAAEMRWSTSSGGLVIASIVAVVLLALWSALSNVNARRLLAVPESVKSRSSRIIVGGLILAGAPFVGEYVEDIDIAQLIAVGLVVIGLLVTPPSFARMNRVANQSTIVARPFRAWRAFPSLAYVCYFASQLTVHQRWGLHSLVDELSPESLMLAAAERSPVVAPTEIVDGVTTTIAPLATPVTDAAVSTPLLPSIARVSSQTIENRLVGEAVLMTLATLALAVTAASIAVGVSRLDRRHHIFGAGGMTIREAKSLV